VGCLNQPASATATVTTDKVLSSELGKIIIDWTNNSTIEDGFKIERRTNGGSWSEVGSVGANVKSYTDDDIDDNNNYDYRVRAYKGGSYSEYSATVSGTTADRTGMDGATVATTADTANDEIDLEMSDASDGLLLYMPFEEGQGPTTHDWGSGDRNGTLSGATFTTGNTGNGGALDFNGTSDYVIVPRFTVGSTGNTFSAWVKTTSTDSGKTYSGNAAQNVLGDNTTGVVLGFGLTGGKIQYNLYNTAWNNVTGLANANDGNWHYITATHASDGSVDLYLDGVLDNSGTITYAGNRYINRIGGGYENWATDVTGDEFNGLIDEVRVYGKVLTQEEIINDMQSGVANFKIYQSATATGTYTTLASNPASATGGTITDVGGYRVHTFTSNGTFTPSADMDVDVLIVGGGGSGGGRHGGGGGGGGVIHITGATLPSGGYPVVIGAGGAAVGGTGVVGNDGGDTTFIGETAKGGGGGGSYSSQNGRTGGSGGGGGYAGSTAGSSNQGAPVLTYGGTGTVYGNAGGASSHHADGGGGGGAGSVGDPTDGTYGGDGGAGIQINIDGNNYYWGAGGGGGVWTDGSAGEISGGNGGIGGGGAGGRGSTTGGTPPTGAQLAIGGDSALNSGGDTPSATWNSWGGAGGANTGGGGGGSGQADYLSYGSIGGAAGGSGIVIVRYLRNAISNDNYSDTTATDDTAPAAVTGLGGDALSTWTTDATPTVTWTDATDSGDDYYYYVNAYDQLGNADHYSQIPPSDLRELGTNIVWDFDGDAGVWDVQTDTNSYNGGQIKLNYLNVDQDTWYRFEYEIKGTDGAPIRLDTNHSYPGEASNDLINSTSSSGPSTMNSTTWSNRAFTYKTNSYGAEQMKVYNFIGTGNVDATYQIRNIHLYKIDSSTVITGLYGYATSWTQGTTDITSTTKNVESGAQTLTSSTLTSAADWYLNIRSVDGAGNWDASGDTVHRGPFQIDTTTPDIVAVDAGASSGDRTSLTSATWFTYPDIGSDDAISFSWTDPSSVSNDTFYYELNGTPSDTITGDEATTTNPYVDAIAITDGVNYLHVRPKNGAGTWGTERIFIINYNRCAPPASGDWAPPRSCTITSQTYTVYGNVIIYNGVTFRIEGTTNIEFSGADRKIRVQPGGKIEQADTAGFNK